MTRKAARVDAAMARGQLSLRSETGLAALVFIVLAVLPLLISGYTIYILPQYLLYGVLAMSLSLLWGFAGILSFGQAAFFALGAYVIGLAEQAHPGLVNPTYLALVASLLVGALVAAFTGYFLFSAGVRDIYFVLVTLALSIIVEQITIIEYNSMTGRGGEQ